MMPVKKAGLGLQNTVTSADKKTKLVMIEHVSDSGHDGRKRTINHRSPSDNQGRKA